CTRPTTYLKPRDERSDSRGSKHHGHRPQTARDGRPRPARPPGPRHGWHENRSPRRDRWHRTPSPRRRLRQLPQFDHGGNRGPGGFIATACAGGAVHRGGAIVMDGGDVRNRGRFRACNGVLILPPRSRRRLMASTSDPKPIQSGKPELQVAPIGLWWEVAAVLAFGIVPNLSNAVMLWLFPNKSASPYW